MKIHNPELFSPKQMSELPPLRRAGGRPRHGPGAESQRSAELFGGSTHGLKQAQRRLPRAQAGGSSGLTERMETLGIQRQ